MIAEAIAVVGGVGAVTGWIFAFRARGEAVRAKDQAAAAEALGSMASLRAATAERLQELAATSAATSRTEVEALERAVSMLREQVRAANKSKGDLLARLQANGVPVGDVATDIALDGLYPNPDDPNTGTGTDRRSQDPGDAGKLSDVASDPASATSEKP